MSSTLSALGETGRESAATLSLVNTLQSALRRGDRATVLDTARQLVALRAPLNGQWLQLAMLAAHNGEVALARQAGALYVENSGNDPAAEARTADLLAQVGAWPDVLALMRRLPPDLPTPPSHAYTRGTAALYVGEKDEARHYLEEATRLAPYLGSPWLPLSLLVDFAHDADLADRIIAAEAAMDEPAAADRGAYFYALGKARADRGEHALAFAAYAKGARLTRHQNSYSRERDSFTAKDSVEGYDAGRIAALAKQQSEPTGRGIFVMGLPRSGTTLVEQILTSHSAVSDGAEIYKLGLLIQDIGGLSYPALSKYVEQGKAPAAARQWQHWLDERFPAPGRVVDKTLNTSRLLGIAATLLPEAPLIWIVRDPLDCAWSCFRSRFAGEAGWSYDLEDIAFHFRLEDELLAQWQGLLGERLLVVPYEALVADSETWIRDILAHCGLPEERGPYAPHENSRAVTTASAMQVRRPINPAGIGSAQPYREFLQPFIKAYYD